MTHLHCFKLQLIVTVNVMKQIIAGDEYPSGIWAALLVLHKKRISVPFGTQQ